MTENELDQLLNRWRTPAPSSGLRARVLERFPRRERRGFGRALRWGTAAAVLLCMLAIGAAQSGHGTLENFATGVHRLSEHVTQFFDEMWLGHILSAFSNSHLKIYVDGELQEDAVFGGRGVAWYLRTPGEWKYYLVLSPHVFEGPVPPAAGRFDGHVLEFQSAGRVVRIESSGTYGFGVDRPVYVLGPKHQERPDR
jgi:hypothetical protein